MPMLRSSSNAWPSISMSPVERAAQPVGEQLGARWQRILFGDGDEFVAADARQERALCRNLQPLRGLAQRRVAHRMPEQVVDLLEAVEIDAENREAAAAFPGRVEHLRKMAIQRGAVRQIRQRIMPGQMQDPLFRALAIGHVERHCNAGIAAVIAQRPRLDRHLDDSAIGRDVTAGIVRRLHALMLAEFVANLS